MDALAHSSAQRIEKSERAIAKADEKIARAEAAAKEAHDKLQHMRAKEKEHENELTRLDARVKQLEAQGTEVGNAAAARQRAKIDEIEMAGIELLSEISVQESNEKMRKAELESLRGVGESEKQFARENIEFERQNLEKYAEMRAEALQDVVPELLQVYEEVNKRHPGNALVAVKEGNCGGCSGELTLQLMNQVKRRAEIIRCPMCNRILDSEKR